MPTCPLTCGDTGAPCCTEITGKMAEQKSGLPIGYQELGHCSTPTPGDTEGASPVCCVYYKTLAGGVQGQGRKPLGNAVP